MADTDTAGDAPPAGGGGPDAPKKRASREKLIVGGTLALVILTYLILRRQSANQAAPSGQGYPPSAWAGPGVYGATPGSPSGSGPSSPFAELDPAQLAAITTQLGAIQSAVAAIPANQTVGANTGPTVPPPGLPIYAPPAAGPLTAPASATPPFTGVNAHTLQAPDPSYIAVPTYPGSPTSVQMTTGQLNQGIGDLWGPSNPFIGIGAMYAAKNPGAHG